MDGQSERGMKQTFKFFEFKEPLEHQKRCPGGLDLMLGVI